MIERLIAGRRIRGADAAAGCRLHARRDRHPGARHRRRDGAVHRARRRPPEAAVLWRPGADGRGGQPLCRPRHPTADRRRPHRHRPHARRDWRNLRTTTAASWAYRSRAGRVRRRPHRPSRILRRVRHAAPSRAGRSPRTMPSDPRLSARRSRGVISAARPRRSTRHVFVENREYPHRRRRAGGDAISRRTPRSGSRARWSRRIAIAPATTIAR